MKKITVLFLCSVLLIVCNCTQEPDPTFYLQYDWSIAFLRGNDVFRNIFIYDLERDREKMLSDDFTYESDFTWSADGSKLLFIKEFEGISSLSVFSFDDGTTIPVHQVTGSNPQYSLSPDGSKIAYSVIESGNFASVYIMNSDGTEKQYQFKIQHDDYLIWSNSNSGLYYLDWYGKIINFAIGDSLSENVVMEGYSFNYLSCSENRNRIVFENRNSQFPDGIYVCNMDFTGITQVSDEGYEPKLSHDGSKIVYVSSGFDHESQIIVSTLWSIQTDGTNRQKILETGDTIVTPSWSADGDRITFCIVEQLSASSEAYFVCVVNDDGTGFSALASDSGNILSVPQWRPGSH